MSNSPIVPGTERAGARSYLDQIGGQAFLQAFESLKGGGQITEIEGTKATTALTRLTDRTISYEEAQKANIGQIARAFNELLPALG